MTLATLMRSTNTSLFFAFLLSAAASAHAEWSVPNELPSKVDVLSDEQTQFITSGAILDIIPELPSRALSGCGKSVCAITRWRKSNCVAGTL